MRIASKNSFLFDWHKKLHVLLSCFIKCTKLPVHLGCTSCLFLLYSRSPWWHAEKERSVRELREALLQLSCVKGKTSRVWVQSLTSVRILACVEISRRVQKDHQEEGHVKVVVVSLPFWFMSVVLGKFKHLTRPNSKGLKSPPALALTINNYIMSYT